MTNLTHKEIEEFEKYFAGVEALRGLHSSYKGKGLFLIYLSQKKAEWQDEVIEALKLNKRPESWYEDYGGGIWDGYNQAIDDLENLKSQFKGKGKQ